MLNKLFVYIVKQLDRFNCATGSHVWRQRRFKRVCIHCQRREVLYSEFSKQWKEHTYPLDADPCKDPTQVIRDGFSTTIGQENETNKMFAEIFSKPVRQRC